LLILAVQQSHRALVIQQPNDIIHRPLSIRQLRLRICTDHRKISVLCADGGADVDH
jgi:hypothetical protein